jgi:hypothetical protein
MPLSDKARKRKQKYMHEGKTEPETLKILLEEGYINASYISEKAKKEDPKFTYCEIPRSDHISEEYCEQYLLICAQTHKANPTIASLMIQFLDKKKAFSSPPKPLIPPEEDDLNGFSS